MEPGRARIDPWLPNSQPVFLLLPATFWSDGISAQHAAFPGGQHSQGPAAGARWTGYVQGKLDVKSRQGLHEEKDVALGSTG